MQLSGIDLQQGYITTSQEMQFGEIVPQKANKKGLKERAELIFADFWAVAFGDSEE